MFNIVANSPFLLTRSKGLVRSMKKLYNSTFCSLLFSYSCLTDNITSEVESLDLNPHWNLKYIISAGEEKLHSQFQ